jgi:hypothetical protein
MEYVLEAAGTKMQITDSTWHPEFGLTVANKKIELHFNEDHIELSLKRVK